MMTITKEVACFIEKSEKGLSNASLYFDKYCEHKNWPVEKHTKAKINSLKTLLRILDSTPAEVKQLRKDSFSQLVEQLTEEGNGEKVIAHLNSPLAIGLSDGIIENGGITLDRITGEPYIRGTALKGAARHAAYWKIKDTEDLKEKERLAGLFFQVFGCIESDIRGPEAILEKWDLPLDFIEKLEEQKGMVTFFSGYPMSFARIKLDLSNVHTPDYYTGNKAGNMRELKKEKTTPNLFPTVSHENKQGCQIGTKFKFLIALTEKGRSLKNKKEVLGFAISFLQSALVLHGIGAKTAAGHGVFKLNRKYEEEKRKRSAKDQEVRLSEDERFLKEVEKSTRKHAKEINTFEPSKQKIICEYLAKQKKKWKSLKKGELKEHVPGLIKLGKSLGVELT